MFSAYAATAFGWRFHVVAKQAYGIGLNLEKWCTVSCVCDAFTDACTATNGWALKTLHLDDGGCKRS
jgi:hypothetical protein